MSNNKQPQKAHHGFKRRNTSGFACVMYHSQMHRSGLFEYWHACIWADGKIVGSKYFPFNEVGKLDAARFVNAVYNRLGLPAPNPPGSTRPAALAEPALG